MDEGKQVKKWPIEANEGMHTGDNTLSQRLHVAIDALKKIEAGIPCTESRGFHSEKATIGCTRIIARDALNMKGTEEPHA